jgi:putative hydrolase of the HAD superfamily
MPIRAICFDLFHTLVDVGQVPEAVGRFTADILELDRHDWNEACFSQHHPITHHTNHRDVIQKLAHSLNPDIPTSLIEEAVDHRQRRFDYALREVEAKTLEILDQLKQQGYPLALISNASTAEVSGWQGSPLKDYFDVALFSCDVGLQKPDPAIYRLASEKLNIRQQQCLFIGDGGSNEHLGARQSGMHPVMITRYIDTAKQQARRPHCRWEIANLTELPTLLVAIT